MRACFSPLRFEIKSLGEREVERVETYWDNGNRQTKTVKVKIHDKVCVAWAKEKEPANALNRRQ